MLLKTAVDICCFGDYMIVWRSEAARSRGSSRVSFNRSEDQTQDADRQAENAAELPSISERLCKFCTSSTLFCEGCHKPEKPRILGEFSEPGTVPESSRIIREFCAISGKNYSKKIVPVDVVSGVKNVNKIRLWPGLHLELCWGSLQCCPRLPLLQISFVAR